MSLSVICFFALQCKPGYAGNGFHCGDDSDSDGIPDRALPCGGIACQAVSFKLIAIWITMIYQIYIGIPNG